MKASAALSVFTAGVLYCSGAEYSVQSWDVDDGLPESGITDVVQSRDGYLWISTLISGVTRYHGVRFVNFEPPLSQPGASLGIRRLLSGSDETIWMNGFGSYFASLREGRFQMEYTNAVVINAIVRDTPGFMAFETREGQLLEGTSIPATNRVWKLVTQPATTISTHFFADAAGIFWYRGTNEELYRFVNGNAEILS